MKTAKAEFFERERLGVLTTPSGQAMRFSNVTLAQFKRIVAGWDAKYRSDARAADGVLTR